MTKKIAKRILLLLVLVLIIYSFNVYITQTKPKAEMIYRPHTSNTTVLGTHTSK